MTAEYWEDRIPDPDEDGVEAYLGFFERLHDYKPGKPEGKYGTRRCTETMYRRDGTTYECGGYSHDTNHKPLDCCFCKHGVYLHTSYDIPCGTCEMESSYDGEYDGDS